MNLFAKTRMWVSDLRENQAVDEVFMVSAKSLRFTRSGNPFLALELGDRTGRIQARLWENAEALQGVGEVDHFVRVSGQVAQFNETLQVNLVNLEAVPDESVDLTDYLPASRRDPEAMEKELRELCRSVNSPPLRDLVLSLFSDCEFWALFRRAPAAKEVHHATLGGLLEHTLGVANLCRDIALRYPELDADLVLVGALLHDMGKTRELNWSRRFDYTDEGGLIGHVVIGAELVAERARRIENFPPETLLRLRHLLLSHHGQPEWGAPKVPMIAEAFVLHYADDLDCKLNTVAEALTSSPTEDRAFHHFTPYHRTLKRYLYRGGPGGGPKTGR
jgi:3'-5' exoribonuclease